MDGLSHGVMNGWMELLARSGRIKEDDMEKEMQIIATEAILPLQIIYCNNMIA